jgi:hypothetical protein
VEPKIGRGCGLATQGSHCGVQTDTVAVEGGNTDSLPSFRPPTLTPNLLPCKAYILTLTQMLVSANNRHSGSVLILLKINELIPSHSARLASGIEVALSSSERGGHASMVDPGKGDPPPPPPA